MRPMMCSKYPLSLLFAALVAACTAFIASPAWAGGTARNATELRDLLRGPATAATLDAIRTDSGCAHDSCAIDVGELHIDRDKGGFSGAGRGKRLRLIEHKPIGGELLPEIDWTPTDAYRVTAGGRRWGICMEFPHRGIGKNGVHQRWTSVVLVPFRSAQPGAAAHRFVGYWAGCDSLQVGAVPEQVVLPVVEYGRHNAPRPLRLAKYRCTAKGCEGRVDELAVDGDPSGEMGALVIGGSTRIRHPSYRRSRAGPDASGKHPLPLR